MLTHASPHLQTLCKQPRWKSDSLTVVEVPQGIDSNKVRGRGGTRAGLALSSDDTCRVACSPHAQIVKAAYAKYDLSIGIGLAQINGKVFRIGASHQKFANQSREELNPFRQPPRPALGGGGTPTPLCLCLKNLLMFSLARPSPTAKVDPADLTGFT